MNRTGGSEELESQSLSERLSEWRRLLERCGRKPGRKRVHALRVVTLRIQAEVEGELRDLPCASHEAQAILDFGRRAEKLRDSLGAVRELDVWIGKLKDLRESLSESTEYVPRSTRETAQQIERLEYRLAKKRDKAAEKLVTAIERRQDDLLSTASDVEKAIGDGEAEVDEGRASKLLKEFAGIVAEFPNLDEGNLHDFRKRIKKIRYMAEIHAADPVCDRIAVQVKKAQDAIGEWHDWQVLARTAGSEKRAKNSHAVELLSSLTSEAYETALGTCDSVGRRMADLAHGTDTPSKTSRKPPARTAPTMRESASKLA
ncbi:MAG: CHAD domain-containing protein [Acidobacteria bacterium]|nr:CHAD domain-containing protein [Acidobacteriota bacterium]